MELKVENFVFTLYFTRFVLSLQPMKNLCNILVLILALVVFNLGAGAGVVHICSAYCKTQTCSSVTHSHTDMSGCCHHSNDDSVHYNIDYFFKVSHEDDVVSFIQMPFDLPEHVSNIIPPVSVGLLFSQAPNAPPVCNSGRTLLAFHSVLII